MCDHWPWQLQCSPNIFEPQPYLNIVVDAIRFHLGTLANISDTMLLCALVVRYNGLARRGIRRGVNNFNIKL